MGSQSTHNSLVFNDMNKHPTRTIKPSVLTIKPHALKISKSSQGRIKITMCICAHCQTKNFQVKPGTGEDKHVYLGSRSDLTHSRFPKSSQGRIKIAICIFGLIVKTQALSISKSNNGRVNITMYIWVYGQTSYSRFPSKARGESR